jgi:predicted dehydrogenase
MNSDPVAPRPSSTRREFLKSSTATVLTGALAGNLALTRGAYAGGDDVLRVGLIGCGGRGTGAAAQALSADPNVKLVAMGDTFRDRLESSLKRLQDPSQGVAEKVAVDPDHQFVGFDAYLKVIDSVDVVLLAEPPHFRPAHLKAAVEAGKHVFAEKPVAVDAPGVRSVLATSEEAKKKGLSLVSGLCWRYHQPMREGFQRVHDGAIGEIVTMQCTYHTSELWKHDRQPEWSDMEWQIRNWLYFTWLSGDHINEQHIHSIDKLAWAMKDESPVKASGVGGRQVRTSPAFGHVYDHFSVCYEYAGGVKAFSSCRQQDGCANDVSDHIIGTKGVFHTLPRQEITGEDPWRTRDRRNTMYQTEHDELFASIRSGNPINNGDYMTKSTLMCIMGRMSAYTGQTITWEQALNSQEDLRPPRYDWISMEVPPVAMPGLTQFA